MEYINIILLLSIILLYCIVYPIESYESNDKKKYDVIISINVHEKVNFLLKQLNNIKENVKCNYAVILNCNDYMYNELSSVNIPDENIYINDEVINKNRFNGSLTHGIYSNIKYALKHFDFQYFIVCSSRNFFDNNMTIEDLNKVIKLGEHDKKLNKTNNYKPDYSQWHWPTMTQTLLAKYYIEKEQRLYDSGHEGLLFTYSGCNKITEFLESHEDIKNDLFNFHVCSEEFALQTIAANQDDYFYYIGNGCCTEEKNGPNNETTMKFMYKVQREGQKSRYSFLTCQA